jgi:D-alanine-D-alanine ligase
MPIRPHRGRVLVLWNQTEEDVYEKWRAEGKRTLDWDPNRTVPDVGTVQEEMDQLIGGLREARFEVELVNLEDDLDRLIGAIRLYRPDAVFNLVEYFLDDQANEAYVAGLYELLGASYTGNRPITLATCMNKYRTKLLLEAAGLPTADFFLASRPAVAPDHQLQFPLIVKPAFEDASGGIEPASVVHDHDELSRRVAHVLEEFEMPALVEEYIEGREIHAAILGNSPPEVLPLFEMEFDTDGAEGEPGEEEEWQPQIISFRAKWDPHSREFYSMDAVVPPQDLDEEVEEAIRQAAVGAFKAVRCRDYARVDMRVDAEGQPFILEVNPNPDLTDGAAFMMCAEASGRTFSETLGAIADLAVARGRRVHRVDADRAALPSDQLLREFVIDKKKGPRPGPGGGGGGAGPGDPPPT